MRRENIQNVLKNANANLIDQEIIAKLYKSVSPSHFENLQSYSYQRHTSSTKKLDICPLVFTASTRKHSLKQSHDQFVLTPVGKDNDNTAFICKHMVLLKELAAYKIYKIHWKMQTLFNWSKNYN